MAKNFHEQLEVEALPLPSERSTGLVFAAVALLVAAFFRANSTVLYTALAVAAGFAGLALAAPQLLGPLNRVWFKFAMLLNKVMSPIVMGILFLVTIVPFGLAMQLRRDPLRKRRAPGQTTYWIDRTPSATPTSMRNQF